MRRLHRSKLRRPLAGTTDKEIKCYRKKLRAGIQSLNPREIRRYRVPYHEAMFDEMLEDGYHKSADYIARLIRMDLDNRAAVGDESLLKGQPKLQDQSLYLDKLRLGLTEAEVANMKEEYHLKYKAILKLALFFANRAMYLWWIAEQLFIFCIEESKDFHSDGGLHQATLKYLYGLFVLEKLRRPVEACCLLQQARQSSVGKVWSAEMYMERPQKTIFVETCSLLVKAYVQIAEEIRFMDSRKAIRLCNQAIRRSLEADRIDLQTESFLSLGLSQMEYGDFKAALKSFTIFLENREEVKDPNQICLVYLNMAVCYKMTGQVEETENNLMSMKEIAQAEGLTEQVSAADRFLGEYYLTTGTHDCALSHLLSSFSTYHQEWKYDEMEETRALAAVAMGQTILPVLADHILLNNNRGINALLRWKNQHIGFWEDASDVPGSESKHSLMYQFMHARSTSEVRIASQTISREESVFKILSSVGELKTAEKSKSQVSEIIKAD